MASTDIELQERDYAIFLGFFECRVMTLQHASDLYFAGHKEAAKKRIQKLKGAGFFIERPRRVSEPAILALTGKALEFLASNKLLIGYPKLPLSALVKRGQVSELTVNHELAVMDVKAALSVSLRSTERFILREFTTWPRLNEFMARRPSQSSGGAQVLVKPDGFIRIEEKEPDDGLSEHTFFLELDRSTETQETLILRASCYADYYRSGGLAERHGQPQTAYKDFPFRLLIVCKSTERRNNAAERLLQLVPPILTLAWLTTLKEILANPLGAIWLRPVDYRAAIQNSPFAPERLRSLPYRRFPGRDELVEKQVGKKSLLEE